MSEKGYDGASLRNIARRAGVSVTALYRHYDSKHDFLVKETREGYEANLEELRATQARSAPDALSQLLAFIDSYVRPHISTDRGRYTSIVIHREHRRLGASDREDIRTLKVRRREILRSIIDRGALDGTFRVPSSDAAARAILALGSNAAQWCTSTSSADVDMTVITHQRLALALVGFRAASGDEGGAT